MPFTLLSHRWWTSMWQPHSIRFHLTAVFLVFFLLVVILGLFSIWRLNNFNRLSADVAELWLPDLRVLGELNNFTADFRALEGGSLLSTDPDDVAANVRQMTDIDHSVEASEGDFERIRHDSAENQLYQEFKNDWKNYHEIVDHMLVLSRTGRRAEALAMYGGVSRLAYDAASGALDRLTDQAVVNAQAASDRLDVAYRQAFWLILLGMAVGAIMVVAALIHISRSISSPLLHLAERMRQLAASNTDTDIPETERRDEIGEMAQATVVFRNNAIELMRSQRMLARQAAMLEEQLAQEQRLTLLQRNFVSMASHEFRTPLTIIDGHARRLIKMKESVAPPEIEERAGKVRAAILRLTHLIDNMLNSARVIDSGAELYFQPAEMDVVALLRETCQLHREMVPAAQIVERFPSGPILISGDSRLLFQVFSNLLSNAIKYSPGGGPIEVDADVVGDEVAVSFADRGIGIPAADLDRLFERYHRGGNVSGIVGTGVGLYLVKVAVELHGGSIQVASKEGSGSRFSIKLPVKGAQSVRQVSPADVASDRQAGELSFTTISAEDSR